MVVSDGVMRGRVAHGVMWRRHRGTWRPKAQAQKKNNDRVTPLKPPATFLGDLAIRKRFITLVTRGLGIVRMSTTTMTQLKRRRHRGHIVYHRRGCRCRWATNVAIRWHTTSAFGFSVLPVAQTTAAVHHERNIRVQMLFTRYFTVSSELGGRLLIRTGGWPTP